MKKKGLSAFTALLSVVCMPVDSRSDRWLHRLKLSMCWPCSSLSSMDQYACLLILLLLIYLFYYLVSLPLALEKACNCWLQAGCLFTANSFSCGLSVCWVAPYLAHSFSFLSDSSYTPLWSYLQKPIYLKQSSWAMQNVHKVIQLFLTLSHLVKCWTHVKPISAIGMETSVIFICTGIEK